MSPMALIIHRFVGQNFDKGSTSISAVYSISVDSLSKGEVHQEHESALSSSHGEKRLEIAGLICSGAKSNIPGRRSISCFLFVKWLDNLWRCRSRWEYLQSFTCRKSSADQQRGMTAAIFGCLRLCHIKRACRQTGSSNTTLYSEELLALKLDLTQALLRLS